jgi:transposase
MQHVSCAEITLTITARATSPMAVCPACQHRSHRVHSYYRRSPQDLPVSGQAVHLILHVRRFRCQNRSCRQQTFVEHLPEAVPRYARRTVRLVAILSLFATALSGQVGSRLLKQIGMAVSADTLLRLAKQARTAPVKTPKILGVDDFAFRRWRLACSGRGCSPKILGVDDFAFRRGRTYGTILVNLETHRPIDLFAERTAEGLFDWLKRHPGVEVISRDRSTEYARGASEGAPKAKQVADRWHILKNLREAAERALKHIHADLVEQKKAAGHPLASRRTRRRSQTEIATSKVARLRRQARYEEVVALYTQGVSVLGIADQLRMSRGTVRNLVYAGAFPERASTLRANSLLDPYVPYLEKRMARGCCNATQLWKELQEHGFVGGYKIGRASCRERVSVPV